MLWTLLDSPFVQNALFASVLLSIGSGIIGSLIVANKSVFLAGGVAHSAFGGVGIALFLGYNALFGAIMAALVISGIMVYASLAHKGRLDIFISILWAFGMALGIVLIELTPGYKINMESYLFGALAFSTTQDIYAMAIFDVVLVVFVTILYREILGILYDIEFCALKGLPTKSLIGIIFMLTAIGVVLGMRSGGLVLVISTLSIPAYIAMLFAKNLKMQFGISIALCLFCMFGGFGISYIYDLALGACVVLFAVMIFICALSIRFLTTRIKRGRNGT